MSRKPILIHPDPRLKKTAQPMRERLEGLSQIIDDMFETMYDAPGIGLAAPQIGLSERLFVMDASKDENPDPYVMINPVIEWESEEQSVYEEGCLSIPEIYEEVTRPAVIRVSYFDQDFKPQTLEADGLYATCIQHELDHLDGKLFIDYLSPLKRQLITRKMQKLKKERAKSL